MFLFSKHIWLVIVVIPLAAAGSIRVVGNNTNVSLGGSESVIARGNDILVTELDDEVATAKGLRGEYA